MTKENSIFDEIPLMDSDAQELYVNSLIGSRALFNTVNHVLEAKYFDEHLQKPIGFLKDYFQRHKTIPSKEIIKTATKFSPSDVEVIGKEDIDFMANQIANFCKFRAVISTVLSAPQMIKENDLGKLVKDLTSATQISLNTDLGINYFENVEERIILTANTDAVIPTGWDTVDADIEGIGRQELILFLAPSGGGKSVGMANLALNLCAQGLNGVYFSLEMRDNLVARRFDSMISSISGRQIYDNLQRVVDEVNYFHQNSGMLHIKRMREGSNANDFSAYCTNLIRQTGTKIDFMVIDYADIAGCIDKVDSGNMFIKDKFVAEEIRALGMDFDSIIISASQLGRDAWEKIRNNKPLGQDDIQGGMSKINTSDVVIAVIRDEAMYAAQQVKFQYLKTRNSGGVGKSRMLTWDAISLRITDLKEEVKKSVVDPRAAKLNTNPTINRPNLPGISIANKGSNNGTN